MNLFRVVASLGLASVVSVGGWSLSVEPAAAEASLGNPKNWAQGARLGNFENDNWVAMPEHNVVDHCSSYGCRTTKRFRFSARDLIEVAVIMSAGTAEDTPKAERSAMREAVAWMERRVGKALGTDRDSTSISFWAAGSEGQHDCVDEARNTAAYLTVLQANGLLRHHNGIEIVHRGNMLRGAMLHYGVVVRERGSRQVWAVDSGVGPNGAKPRVELAQRWFARGRSSLPRRFR